MGAYLRRDARVRGGIEALLARFPMLAINRDGTTILMVEQNAKKALARPQPLRGHRARAARQPRRAPALPGRVARVSLHSEV